MTLHLRDISAAYGKTVVINGLELTVTGPGLVCLLGENGSGKSTLLKVIGGFLNPGTGRVMFQGEDLHGKTYAQRARISAYMPQSGIPDPAVLVYDFILMGRKPYFTWKEGESDHAAVQGVIEELGLEKFAFRQTGALSGGEQQKVLLARILAQDTPLLLLDEPTSNLDIRYQVEILTLLHQRVLDRGLLVLMSIHDLNMAVRFSDQLVLLNEGRLHSQGPWKEILTYEALKQVYGIDAEITELASGPVVVPKTGIRRAAHPKCAIR